MKAVSDPSGHSGYHGGAHVLAAWAIVLILAAGAFLFRHSDGIADKAHITLRGTHFDYVVQDNAGRDEDAADMAYVDRNDRGEEPLTEVARGRSNPLPRC